MARKGQVSEIRKLAVDVIQKAGVALTQSEVAEEINRRTGKDFDSNRVGGVLRAAQDCGDIERRAGPTGVFEYFSQPKIPELRWDAPPPDVVYQLPLSGTPGLMEICETKRYKKLDSAKKSC